MATPASHPQKHFVDGIFGRRRIAEDPPAVAAKGGSLLPVMPPQFLGGNAGQTTHARVGRHGVRESASDQAGGRELAQRERAQSRIHRRRPAQPGLSAVGAGLGNIFSFHLTTTKVWPHHRALLVRNARDHEPRHPTDEKNRIPSQVAWDP